MSEAIRVVICDDHAVVREGLKAVLADGGFQVVGEASTGFEAVAAVRAARPDVALLDIQMPGMDGIEAARQILAEHPKVKLLALTTFGDEKRVLDCMRAGFHGYVLKDVDKLDLKKHIRALMRGEAVIDPKVASVLMARVRTPLGTSEDRGDSVLTPQQLAILRLVAQGYSNREVGERMHLSENTVKGHVAEVLHRLGLKNRVEAALMASTRGWL